MNVPLLCYKACVLLYYWGTIGFIGGGESSAVGYLYGRQAV